MDPHRRTRLLAALDADASARAAAVTELRMLDLGRPDLLAAALRVCDDDRPLPEGFGGRAPADPFAAFFGDAAASVRTLGEHAADCLAAAGLPGQPEVADVLAASLAEAGCSERRAATIARLLAEAPWDDRAGAVAAVVPALIRADVSLYAVIATADPQSIDALVARATSPFADRLTNELLNHDPARQPTLEALADAVTGGALGDDGSEALQIVGLLFQWGSPRAGEAAIRLEARHPWMACFVALEDPAAAGRLVAWCNARDEHPPGLGRVLELVLGRVVRPDYPLAAVLDRLDGTCEAVIAQEAVDDCADLLRRWAAAGIGGTRPERGWEATRLLCEAGRLGEVGPAVVDAVGRGEVPLDRALLLALAKGPAGMGRALQHLVERHPSAIGVVLPALREACDDGALRASVEALLTIAEGAPVVEIPARRGLVERRRDGVDVPALRPAIEELGDPALTARFEALLPVIGPRG